VPASTLVTATSGATREHRPPKSHRHRGVDPNPDGTVRDKGCGAKKPDSTLGNPVLTDVTTQTREGVWPGHRGAHGIVVHANLRIPACA
jgi:hypothetical protein